MGRAGLNTVYGCLRPKPGVRSRFTAIDDYSRYKVVALSPEDGPNTLRFLDTLIKETRFPIPRIQTDRSREFFAYKVQERLMNWGIKFRPVQPRSPHLNGKLERSQRIDWDKFYSSVALDSPALPEQLQD
jgi:transposase InsO family protein